MKSNAENSKIEVEIRYLQGKLKEYEAENSHLKRQIDDYKLFNHKRMTEIGEWKERISSGFESVDDFKKNYEEYLNLKKV